MRGKLIAIDGVDSSGKGLQTQLLLETMEHRGLPVRKLRFPVYESDSSALVKMYLAGEMGGVSDVNGYAASLFFAADRYASYKMDWGKPLSEGLNMVCDRYVSSNAIHQAVKVPLDSRDEFLGWVMDLEYKKMGLPKPDLTIFLDMPVDVALSLMDKRYHGDASKKDIHEADRDYLLACHEAAVYAADHFGWARINCVENGKLLSPHTIHEKIMDLVDPLFKE